MATLRSFKENGMIGYKNDEGKTIIKPLYIEGPNQYGSDSLGTDRYGIVRKGKFYGVIDDHGDIVIQFKYSILKFLTEDLLIFSKSFDIDPQIGIINLNDTIIIPDSFTYIATDDCFIKCRNHDSSTTWFNKKGKKLCEGNRIHAEFNTLLFEDNNRIGLMNSEGEVIVPAEYEELQYVGEHRIIAKSYDSKTCGVITDGNEIIISFDYAIIKSNNGTFFHCYRKYEDKERGAEVWLNYDGCYLFEGPGEELSAFFIAKKKNNLLGVFNQQGVIVPIIYDDVRPLHNCIVVGKDKKLGILNKDGGVIVNPSYSRIECVVINEIKDEVTSVQSPVTMDQDSNHSEHNTSTRKYDHYNTYNVLDTACPTSDLLYHREIKYVTKNNGTTAINNYYEKHFDLNKVFILSNEMHEDLFSINGGYYSHGSFQRVLPLTEHYYAVQKDNYWGIYSTVTAQLIIKCDNDRIVYGGGNCILICKNNLWGAKSLTGDALSTDYIDIACGFSEIKLLDSNQKVFGVKKQDKYFIIDRQGRDILSEPFGTDTQFKKYYSKDRILTSVNGKWGFISLVYLYDVIPFVYDLIEERIDGFFDVKLGQNWGVLSIDGNEIVAIKYEERIPVPFNGSIVNCNRERPFYFALSTGRRFGVLGEDGSEMIPSIYDDIHKEGEFYFVALNYSDAGIIPSAQWGCYDIHGKLITPPLYDSLSIRAGYIMAGRDGFYDEKEYTGVYDLFSSSGELIIGGFYDFYVTEEYISNKTVLHFLINRHWKNGVMTDCGVWGDISIKIPDDTDARWLEIDDNLCSIKVNKKGQQVTFPKGFLIKIEHGDNGYSFNFDESIL